MEQPVPGPVLGIDIGGSSLKGALVDTSTGDLLSAVATVATPVPATPVAVARAAQALSDMVGAAYSGVGVAFPGVIRGGRTLTAANVDASWVGAPAQDMLSDALGRQTWLLNDADAAGLAEVSFGAGRGLPGTVLVLTFGTGIGSALLADGRLVPRFELGHLELDGAIAESRASAFAKTREGLDWPEWSARVQHFLLHVDRLLGPDAVIVGGAISEDAQEWVPLLDVPFPVIPATLRNGAGAVGAALHAARMVASSSTPVGASAEG